MLKLMSFRAGIRPHLTNHCLRGTLVTVLSLVTSFLTTTLRRGSLNQPPATSPTIESKLTTIDLPSTNKRSCPEALSSFLHGHEDTSGDKENRARRQLDLQATSSSTAVIQASPASILVQHNQVAVLNNMHENHAHGEQG